MCTYIKNSNTPCKECPRRITALHICDFLKETLGGPKTHKKQILELMRKETIEFEDFDSYFKV